MRKTVYEYDTSIVFDEINQDLFIINSYASVGYVK
jgi:hypothetical protein